MQAIKVIKDKIKERDSLYVQTWREVPLADLISVARLKTYRASTMLRRGYYDKLLDDLIDCAAYCIFAIERLLEEKQCNK